MVMGIEPFERIPHCDVVYVPRRIRFPLKSIEPILRLENLALVEVIHQHRPWRMAVHPNTPLGMRPNTGRPSP